VSKNKKTDLDQLFDIDWNWVKKGVEGGIAYGIIATLMMFLLTFTYNLAGINLLSLYYGPAFLPMSAMNAMYFVPFVAGFLYALVYGVVRSALPGRKLEKGLAFGFIIWLIATLPGMLMTAATMTVPSVLVVEWTFTMLANLVTGGAAIAWIYGDK